MIVCVCKSVSDRTIRQSVEEGVVSLRELTRLHGLGTCCGKCVPHARDVLSAALAQQGATASVQLPAPAMVIAAFA